MSAFFSLLRHFTFFLLLACGTAALYAQPEIGETDSTDEWEDWDEWNLDSLDPEEFEFGTDLIGHLSHGWFPRAFSESSLSISFPFGYAHVFDRTNDLRSSALVPTTAPFSWHDPYDCNEIAEFFGIPCRERQILEPNTDKPLEDGFPTRAYGEYGLRFLHNFPMPLVFRADAAIQFVDGMIYSEDTTRSYLTLSGREGDFREIGTVYYEQYLLNGSVGLRVPIYGVFLESEATTVSSYYYVEGGLSGGVAVWNKATQYAQIADAKNQLRYGNGQDTLTLLSDINPKGFNRFRTAAEASLGWHFSAEFFSFDLEAFLSVPFSSVVNDASWKQYFGGFRMSLGYAWGHEEQDN